MKEEWGWDAGDLTFPDSELMDGTQGGWGGVTGHTAGRKGGNLTYFIFRTGVLFSLPLPPRIRKKGKRRQGWKGRRQRFHFSSIPWGATVWSYCVLGATASCRVEGNGCWEGTGVGGAVEENVPCREDGSMDGSPWCAADREPSLHLCPAPSGCVPGASRELSGAIWKSW